MSKLIQRFLLVSDMHYTVNESERELKKKYPEATASAASGHAFGKTQEEKVEKIYEDILAENEISKLDAVLVLGDLSIDDYDFRCLPFNYCEKFKKELMDRLPCPAYAIPGNHDSYTNDIWKSVMGCDRRYSFEIGECAFIMDDSFAALPANPKNPASGSIFTPMDAEFLKSSLDKHRAKRVFLCSHYINTVGAYNSFSPECEELVRKSRDLICMFRGHTHVHSVTETSDALGHRPIIDIGGYGYCGQKTDTGYEFNIFDEKWAWGYQILEIYEGFVKTYHVRVKNTYRATNGIFDITRTETEPLIFGL